MGEPGTGKRPIWQFTLREMLLAMTAAGALVALAVKSMPSPATTFFQTFDAMTELRVVLDELGVQPGSSGGGSAGSSHAWSRRRRWDYSSRQTTVPLGEIAVAYDARIQSLLDRHGCDIRGRGSAGKREDKTLRGFSYSYQRGATWGELWVEFVDDPSGDFRVYVFCNEFSRR